MRTLISLIILVLSLVGAASAWDTTEQLIYQYTKQINMQSGQDLGWLDGFSHASFSSTSGYGDIYGSVWSDVGSITAELQPVDGLLPDTHNSVTQWGSEVLVTKAPDPENPTGIQFAGAAQANQEVALSGNYNLVEAYLYQGPTIEVGIGGWGYDYTGDSGYGSSSGSVNSYDDFMIEANIGQSTEVELEQINAPGALPTMSGQQTTWAGFNGAYDANGDGYVGVDTAISGIGDFNLNDWG